VRIPDDLSDWEKAYLESTKLWRQRLRNNGITKQKCSVRDFILDLIKSGCELYKGTKREDTWMIWHDALSILWDQATQAWLKTLKCPIEGKPERTWYDRFVRICGSFNDMVSKRYVRRRTRCQVGDSPNKNTYVHTQYRTIDYVV
jgi:hypothetical protein